MPTRRCLRRPAFCVQLVPKGSNINIPMFVMFKNEKCAAQTSRLSQPSQPTDICAEPLTHCLSAVAVTL